jgi:hypothetical protein
MLFLKHRNKRQVKALEPIEAAYDDVTRCVSDKCKKNWNQLNQIFNLKSVADLLNPDQEPLKIPGDQPLISKTFEQSQSTLCSS